MAETPRPPPKPVKAKGTNGRPTKYTERIARTICARIADGETLIEICKTPGYPRDSTVRGWDLDNLNGFSSLYARSRRLQIERAMEEIKIAARTPRMGVVKTTKQVIGKDGKVKKLVEVREGDMIEARRLDVDAMKWIISKVAWRDYGVAPGGAEDGSTGGAEVNVTVKITGGLPDA